MARIFVLLFLFVAVALPGAAAAEVINRIAATVNDDVITTYDVAKETDQLAREAEKKAPLSLAEKTQLPTLALNRLIDRMLVMQKIKELNIKVTDDEVRQAIEDVKKQNNISQETLTATLQAQGLSFEQYKAQLREQLERLRLMSQEVRDKVVVGEKEMLAYYDANRAKYGEVEMFRARHIFFRIDPKASPEEVAKVTATAQSVLQEARSGKDFAELAKQYSSDTESAKSGGELGAFKQGEMLPEIEGTVLAMKPGGISDLIKTPSGIHIIKLEERFMSKPKPFSDVKGDIENLLYQKKSDERFNLWLTELRKEAAIEIKQ
jgi:peptidyl-prolyl cis-trans isomerase SurA